MLKRIALSAVLILTCLSGMYLQIGNFAAAYPISEVPPKVNVPEMNVNASVFLVNGELWAKIDAEYKMHSITSYGDSYLVENYGMGQVLHPDSKYMTVTVTQDILEAHYPIPANSTNISVELNGIKVEVQQDARGFFHLFGSDLTEVNWTVSPVLDNFKFAVHYEHPVDRTTQNYDYLGDYAVALPLYGRYGCSNISYPLYSWYGYPPNNYSIQIETKLANLQVYSVDTQGALTPLNSTIVDGSGQWVTTLNRTQGSSFIHGAVMVFNAPLDESSQFPVALVAAASIVAVLAIVCVIILVLRRLRKPTINLNR